jgi:hypothetical protein
MKTAAATVKMPVIFLDFSISPIPEAQARQGFV